jgi:hypothetical protein
MLGRRVTLALGLAAAAGCGGGAGRYDVSGKVTFGGKPVPAGTVVFEPDAAKGNDGPQGFAPITGGTYDTARGGRGTVGGPHRVTVLGCDGVRVTETSPQGKPLFDPYVTAADLPRATTTVDFDVPAAGR